MDPTHHRNHQQSQKTTTPTPQDTWHNERFQPIVNIHDLHPTRSRIWQLALSNTTQQQRDTLEIIQRRAIRICLRIPLFSPVHHSSLLHHAKLPTLSSRLLVKQALLAWDIHHQTSPPPHHTCNNHILHHNVNTNHTPFDRQGPTPSDTHTRTGTEIPPSTVPSPSTTHSLSTSQPNLVEILSETMHPVFF